MKRFNMDEMVEVKDLGLIAALTLLGFSAREIFKEDKTVFYMYDNTDEIVDIMERYSRNDLPVDAQQYSMTIKSVKANIYNL